MVKLAIKNEWWLLMSNMDYSLNVKKFTDFNQAVKVLGQRTYKTYKLCGLSSLRFNQYGDLTVGYEVIDTDLSGVAEYSQEYTKRLFTPKHVWNHLVSMLKLPSMLYDYYELFKKLGQSQLDMCLDMERDILSMFFDHREADKLQREENKSGHYLKDHYISVFTDIHGEFPRVIRSELYRPYSDLDALIDTNDNLKKHNEVKGSDFNFKNATYSPYKLKANFLDNKKKAELHKVGDKVCAGVNMFNSETKDSSYGFQVLMMRLICSNGAVSSFVDNTLKVKHIGADFEKNTLIAFKRALQLSNKYIEQYMNLEKFSEPISNSWNDLLEIPSKLITLNNREKLNLIQVAERESYNFSAYGLVQALTFEGSNNSRTDKDIKRYNDKANLIIENPTNISKWIPNRLLPKKDEKTEINDIGELSLYPN